MKFKEFVKWCNDRAADGCWGFSEAIICSDLARKIRKLPFWKRETEWKKVEHDVTTNIINPTDKKRKALIND